MSAPTRAESAQDTPHGPSAVILQFPKPQRAIAPLRANAPDAARLVAAFAYLAGVLASVRRARLTGGAA